MPRKPELLIVNEFHPETVARLDIEYSTHHWWTTPEADRTGLLESLNGHCTAAATASWVCDPAIYGLESLQLIAAFGVGVDGIDFEKTRQQHIRVTNTPDVLNDAVADLALGLILTTMRNLANADRFVRNREWINGPFPFGRGLSGKTLGIAGLGRIGEAIAQRATPFGMEIAYHNRHPKDLPYRYFDSLEELARESDILLCMLPGGDDTRNKIDLDILRHLGSEGIFINVGRGSSVNEEDLISALEAGIIAAAGLDVYQNEPNVPTRLLQLDNVVLLPHIGSATIETRRAMGQLVIDNLSAFFSGNPLLTEVNQ